ncbi:hypothetical protein SH501x_004294 [Pirellulaceae bacterium SH501]
MDSVPTQSSETSRVLRSAILLITVLIPVLPVVRVYFWEHALPRWYLAHAANEIASERIESATQSLDKSIATDPSVAADMHYWRLRMDILLGKKDVSATELDSFKEQVFDDLNELKNRSLQAAVSDWIGSRLLQERQAGMAVQIMSRFFPPIEERSPVQNNDLAYARAVARTDLDVASDEIDAALKRAVERNPGFLDTKAWVLHQRGENALAREFAQVAIDLLYQDLAGIDREIAQAFYPDSKLAEVRGSMESTGLEDEKVAAAEGLAKLPDISEAQIQQQLKMIAVLRHHRASILEALGDETAAALDRLWLRLFVFNDTDSLL